MSVCVSPDVQSKPIEVTVEEPKAQTVRVGSTVSFICTAKSKVRPLTADQSMINDYSSLFKITFIP